MTECEMNCGEKCGAQNNEKVARNGCVEMEVLSSFFVQRRSGLAITRGSGVEFNWFDF